MEKYTMTSTERSLIETSQIPYAVFQFIDQRSEALAVSKGFLKLFGYADHAQAYRDSELHLYQAIHPEDAEGAALASERFFNEGKAFNVTYRSKEKEENRYRIIHAHGEHVFRENGARLAYVWYTDAGTYFEEVLPAGTAYESLSRSLYESVSQESTFYDPLTGLPAMSYFFEIAQLRANAIAQQGGDPVLLYTDLAGMKYYNHRNGFAEGDQLLCAYAQLFSKYFGSDHCCRLGQDHFAIITQVAHLEQTLEELFTRCQELNNGLSLPVHIGIYQRSIETVSISTACDRAKLACDTLQNRYTSCYSYYNIQMRDAEDKQQYIIANLDKALEEHWIQVYYQPIVRAVNGRVCDEEALARWIDPVRGFMSPGDFIPTLEDARLIYKLDLYVVDRVLEKMQFMRDAGHHLIPQSINLSRSDFETCDIVEEIRRRVDDAGFSHDLITIEITESIVGSNFDFMKEEIERFRSLGFSIWMDDFGSAYSSLGVLQSIRFDLIKFDMRFMQQFNEGERGRIILTELLRMMNSLDIDTVCEGVETIEQVRFLQETGCSKLQGFYYQKPIPVEKIIEKYDKGIQIGFEDPADSRYFEMIGRVNLHDLGIISQNDDSEFSNYFDSLPMAIIEFRGEEMRIARSNSSYRKFLKRHFDLQITDFSTQFQYGEAVKKVPFIRALYQCAHDGKLEFFDEMLPDQSLVHTCLRRIAENPHSGTISVAVAILSIVNHDNSVTYANIARALAADYFKLYYVDLETEDFIEYTSEVGGENLAVERHGKDFFRASRKDALQFLHENDRSSFVRSFTKEHVMQEIGEHGTFTLTYRLLINGDPVYVHMKALRMPQDEQRIIIGVSNVDAQLKQQELLDRARQNQIVYSRLMALSGDYLCIYLIDPKTDQYVEYSASDTYQGLGLAQNGEHFFDKALEYCDQVIAAEDRERFHECFTKTNIMEKLKMKKLFKMQYHLLIGGTPRPVNARVALVREDDGEKLIVGINSISEDAR